MLRNKGVINFIESGKWRQKIEGRLTSLGEFVAHDLGEFLELAIGLRIVALNHDVLKMLPGEIVEAFSCSR